MLTAALGMVTAVLYGSADFMGGIASRKSPAVLVSFFMYATGIVALGAVLIALPPVLVTRTDWMWGAACGVFGTLGVVMLYAALAEGRMGVVAPLTAALAGGGPAAFDLLRGAHVSPAALAGLALALLAVVVVSTTQGPVEEHGMPPRAIVLSVASGAAFALSLISLSATAPASGFMPLLAARLVGTTLLGIAVVARRNEIGSGHGAALRLGAIAGVVDAGANFTMLAAIRIGPLAVASVVGGLYPVTTMLLARAFLGERLKRHQVAGVGLALIAVVLTALP